MAGGIGLAELKRISIAFRELDGTKLKAETALKPGYTPGDLGFDPLSLAPEDPAEFREMQEKELVHARLGMIAAAGFLAQEAVTKATWGTAYGLPDFLNSDSQVITTTYADHQESKGQHCYAWL